jgi:hypothetical protein
MEELLRAGADPTVTTTTGTTVFMAAVGCGATRGEAVGLLLNWVEANPELYAVHELVEPEDNEGKTAYALALEVDRELARLIKVSAPLPPCVSVRLQACCMRAARVSARASLALFRSVPLFVTAVRTAQSAHDGQ